MFGGCPFSFFASEILGLRAVEEPSPDLAPMDLGIIYHGLLERFFRAVAESKSLAGRVTEDNLEAALALLDTVAADYFAGLEKYGRVGSPALWKVQRQNILPRRAAAGGVARRETPRLARGVHRGSVRRRRRGAAHRRAAASRSL